MTRVSFSRTAATQVGALAARYASYLAYEVDQTVDARGVKRQFIARCFQEPSLQLRPPRHTSFGAPVALMNKTAAEYIAKFQFFNMQRAYRWRRPTYGGYAFVRYAGDTLRAVDVFMVRRQQQL